MGARELTILRTPPYRHFARERGILRTLSYRCSPDLALEMGGGGECSDPTPNPTLCTDELSEQYIKL